MGIACLLGGGGVVILILCAPSSSVHSVISVIPTSDITSAASPTITTNNATFISAVLASTITCYR